MNYPIIIDVNSYLEVIYTTALFLGLPILVVVLYLVYFVFLNKK